VDSTERSAAGSSSEPLKVAFILGMGRSGTNFLLDLLDTSPSTHCRNEPDELPGGALEAWNEWKIHRDGQSAAIQVAGELWDDLRRASSCGGERDRPIPPHKSWLRSAATTPLKALSKNRLRKLVPGLSGAEFPLPSALVRSEALADALHVFKINAAPFVAEAFLRDKTDDPNAKVIHIVRNPAGFLRSWRRRWLSERDEEDVLAANLARLDEVLQRDPLGGAFISEVASPDVHETELLFWRYCTERIRAAGTESAAYLEVSYDALAHAPLASLEPVFEHLSLPMTEEIALQVDEMTGGSVGIADAFQSELNEESRSRFERALGPALCEEFSLGRS